MGEYLKAFKKVPNRIFGGIPEEILWRFLLTIHKDILEGIIGEILGKKYIINLI